MTAHLTGDQIKSYRSRSLAADELLEASAHLADCEECRAKIATAEELHAGVDRIRAALFFQHSTYEEMAAYIDGHESDSVESHVRECEQCAADLHELRRAKDELERPAPVPFWRRRFRFAVPVLVAAAACTLIAVLFLRPSARPERPIALATPPPMAPDTSIKIHDGAHVFSITPGGTVAGVDNLSATDRAAVEQALAAQWIQAPALLEQLAGKRSVLLGSRPETPGLELVGPLGTVVEWDRPFFRWKSLPGAQYQVSVYDSQFNTIAASGWMSGAEWQASRPLRRGSRYSWQVKVRRNGEEFAVPGPPMPEARFQVLSAADEADLSQLRSQWGDSHLVLGVRYAQAGMLDDAEQELRALDRENPGSTLTSALLASLEKTRQSR